MILKRNDEFIAEQTTFLGLTQDLVSLGHGRDVISWVCLVQKSQPGTAGVYEYRTANGDLWELR